MKHFSHIRSINYSLVFRIIGWLLMIEAGFMIAPLVVAHLYCEQTDLIAFAIGAAVTLVGGFILTFGLPSHRHDMGKHEGFLLTALVWIVFSIFGMLPFIIGSSQMDVSSAFFESMSGFTTTGCTSLPSVEIFSYSLNLWRSLMQWIGGMGIILFTLAVIPMLNHSGGMAMFNAEVTGITHDKLRPRVSQTAMSLWGMYFLLTAVLVGLLWLGPMSLLDSVCHAFATVSTGGFSTHDASIGFYNSDYVVVVITIFMFLGGTSFTLLFKALHGHRRSLRDNDVFRAYVLIILISYIAILANQALTGKITCWRDATIYPLFQVISSLTSTGLSICSMQNWNSFIILILLLLMFSGACAGSTSGGAKIDRMLILYKNSRNELYRSLHPNAITRVRINNKVVSPDIVAKVVAFLCFYAIVMVVGAILLTMLGVPLLESFFASMSAVSNSGYDSDVIGQTQAFVTAPAAGRWILSALMLIGRLEIFTVLVLLTPNFWRK